MTQRTRPLTIDGIAHAIERATLTIVLDPDGIMTYALSIDVDERSGEDGAAQPVIENIPVFQAYGGRHPTLCDLALRDIDAPGVDWEAWYGNDAPWLDDNRLTFGRWTTAAEIALQWSARNGEGDRPFLINVRGDDPGTIRFDGVAAFDGLLATVDNVARTDRFVLETWGRETFDALTRSDGPWVERPHDPLHSGLRNVRYRLRT